MIIKQHLRHYSYLFIGFLFFYLQWGSSLIPNRVLPGNNGDNRLNLIILENNYQKFKHFSINSIFEQNFFYPFRNVGGFTDSHLATSWIYSILRTFHFGYILSYQIWICVALITTYISAYYVFKILKISENGSIIAATIFAFSPAFFTQAGHSQLFWRFTIPLVFLASFKLKVFPTYSNLLSLLFLICLTLLLNVYLGIFSVFLSLSALIFSPRQELQKLGLRDFKKSKWLALKTSSMLFLIACTIATYYKYHAVGNAYGIHRNWSEIAFFSPHPTSWVSSYTSAIWKPISSLFPQIDGYWENQLFPGLTALCALLIFFLHRNNLGPAKLQNSLSAIKSYLLGIVLTTVGGYFSIFLVLSTLPGLNSIRAVGRIILVLLLPIALLVGYIYDYLQENGLYNLRALLILCTIVDVVLVNPYNSSIDTWINRPNQLIKYVESHDQLSGEIPILFLPDGNSKWNSDSELDGMLAASLLGRKTLNGYSGFTPIWEPDPSSCSSTVKWLSANQSILTSKNTAWHYELPQTIIVVKDYNYCLIHPQEWLNKQS